jgi:hypothetical protein
MTTNKSSAVILANCTHVSLANAFRKSGHFSNVDSFEDRTLAPQPSDEIAKSFAEYDFILTLDRGKKFGALFTPPRDNTAEIGRG